MTRQRKALLIAASAAFLVVSYLASPFPLTTYIARHPDRDGQVGGGLPSRVYYALYNWWIPELSESNPYKELFVEHMTRICEEHPDVCSKETTQQP